MNPEPQTLNPERLTPDLKPYILHRKPKTLNSKS